VASSVPHRLVIAPADGAAVRLPAAGRPIAGQDGRAPTCPPRRPAVPSPNVVLRPDPKSPRLLERVRIALRTRHYSQRSEKAYVAWIRRFILFHGKRHPDSLAEPEIGAFLSSLAHPGRMSASSQNQALAAILFLYGQVLGRELAWLGDLVHAKRPQRIPVVLTRDECRALLDKLAGPHRIVAGLLYGGGLRLLEALHLRIKDIDVGWHEIVVRDGKGRKDRRTVLPASLVPPLRAHLAVVRSQHLEDVAKGPHHGAVELPDALRRKYPSAPREWSWQWIFPRHPDLLRFRHGRDPPPSPARIRRPARRRHRSTRRGHRQARDAPHPPPLVCDPPAGRRLRHPHHPGVARPQDVSTTMIYTHVLNRGGRGVRSPIDR
jgi:integron integrase